MFRPVFLFKILILSLLVNFIFLVYFLFQSSHPKFFISQSDYSESNDYFHAFKNNLPSATIRVIPMPMIVNLEQSKVALSDSLSIVFKKKPTTDLESMILRYSQYISSFTGIIVKNNQVSSSSEYQLTIECLMGHNKKYHYPTLGEDESYMLNVTRTGSYLFASSITGVTRGLSTFVQLIEQNSHAKEFYIQCVHIVDRPRFAWRGLMLDVSRHWMPVPVIKRTLNAMELSKLNVLHLHLSDDQGFRVESVQFKSLHDRKDFFSQKDIQTLVEFARERRIRIVPEFDIPGHTTSWFVGYPDLASEPGPYQVENRWGVMRPTMNPIKENTYQFLDQFFDEMTKLFPDKYFHIGGDEVEGSQWIQSIPIQEFITQHGLINKNGLQAYFNKRIQKLLSKYKKTMIGWEEIIEDMNANRSLNQDAVIQSWKSRKAAVEAIRKGYRSILSHGFYLDHLLSSPMHYKVDPILDDELWLYNSEQLSRILGGEACMWTEFAAENSIDSRIWPRVISVAERLWSPSYMNDTKFLYERLFHMNHLLDKVKTGLTHVSSYKTQLQNLILDQDKRNELLHPFVILADVCEPYGFEQRTQMNKYTAQVPLTTFTDALQSESEVIWRLETIPVNDKIFREIFTTWSVNHVRLRALFDSADMNRNRQLWGQDIELLSGALADVGRVGLKLLDYGAKRILHQEPNHTMNSWPLIQWVSHHQNFLNQLENQVIEVRLAAVRPVRRLLNAIQTLM